MNRTALGLWLADIAANFVVVVVIVIAIASRFANGNVVEEAPRDIRIHIVKPVGGSEAVELLRQRLLPNPSLSFHDITEEAGVFPDNASPNVYFLLSTSGIGSLNVGDPSASVLHVPEALRGAGGTWSPNFLALAAVADDRARFQKALVDLLSTGGRRGYRALADRETASGSPASLAERIRAWSKPIRDFVNLCLLGFVLVVLSLLRRRYLKA